MTRQKETVEKIERIPMAKEAIEDLQYEYDERLQEAGVSAMQVTAAIVDRVTALGYPLGGTTQPPHELVRRVTREVLTELCGEDFAIGDSR